MIERHLGTILRVLLKKYPVITITGPRQAGKTTLAKMVLSEYDYVSLEDPDIREFAQKDPRNFFSKKYNERVIFDEIQMAPELFSYIQGIVDERPTSGRFILTGSQQFHINEKISQSLAGRSALLKLMPFSIAEIEKRRPNDF